MSRLPRAAAVAAAACLALLAAGAPVGSRAAAPPTDSLLDAGAAVSYLVQVDGRIVRQRAATVPRQPASLAKLALAIVAMEQRTLIEGRDRVKVSASAAAAPPSRIGLRNGDRVIAADLLAATLVASANDACLALAQQLAGSAAQAVAAMNRLATRLAMNSSHFADPCGFDQPGQRTSAQDLLKLANAALSYPAIRELAALPAVSIEVDQPGAGRRTLVAPTSNALLLRAEGVTGLKTGYTRLAGRSMIAVANLGDHQVVVVVLGARDRFGSALRLIEHGFEHIDSGRTVLSPPPAGIDRSLR